MGQDHSLELRESVVRKLKMTPDVTAIVAQRIYGEQVIAKKGSDWPFIRMGLPDILPFGASGWDGNEHAFTVHTFAMGPATDAITRLNKAVVEHLDEKDLPIWSGIKASIGWVRTQVIRDTAEAGAYHGIIQFEVLTYINVPTAGATA
jgi:hypothetical protein